MQAQSHGFNVVQGCCLVVLPLDVDPTRLLPGKAHCRYRVTTPHTIAYMHRQGGRAQLRLDSNHGMLVMGAARARFVSSA